MTAHDHSLAGTATSTRLVLGVLFLSAGIAFAVASIYSTSRGICAAWVLAAVLTTLAAGLAFGTRHVDRRR